jgi:hypothetical protein
MLDYHALTIDEPKDSPHKKYQFRVTCIIMIVGFCFMTIPAGILVPIKITEGTFPGGTFIYKSTKRDYVSSTALELHIGTEDLKLDYKHDFEDRIYTLYLDDLTLVKYGRSQRYASGYLSNSSKSDRTIEDLLLSYNSGIEPLNRLELNTLPAEDLWPRIKYKKATLPKVKAAMIYFPSTYGLVSSLMMQFRILPSLRKYATAQLQQQQTNRKRTPSSTPTVTIITTCHVKHRMCTHYAPLEKGDAFLLGQLSTNEYAKTLPAPKTLYETILETLQWSSSSSDNSQEL